MPLGKIKKERYLYRFLDIDNSEIDYYNFLQDVNKQLKDSIFDYAYDAEYFFNTIKKIINESTVQSAYGFDLFCHAYGVNGY